jgi:hypothetical protein
MPCGRLKGPSGRRHSSLPPVSKAIRPKWWNSTTTTSPSVAGEGAAAEFAPGRGPSNSSSCLQRVSPE